MKVPLLLAFAGLALGLVVPTVVQQNTVDPKVRQQIEAAMTKQVEAYNKYDAAAFAAGFMKQAIELSQGGVELPRTGREPSVCALRRYRIPTRG